MASYTLDDIRAAAERKYGSTDIDVSGTTVHLLNPMRLPKEKRDQLMDIQRQLEAANEDSSELDQAQIICEALRVVAQTPAQADALIGAVGDDLAVLAEIFATYGKSQEVGEASASAA